MKFSLKKLLMLVTLVAIVLGASNQLLYSSGQARIINAELVADEGGTVKGTLSWVYLSGPASRAEHRCEIHRLASDEIQNVNVDDEFSFRYRSVELFFLAKQDPHRQFMQSCLNIDEEKVVGYAYLEEWTSIIVDGTK